VEDWQKITPSEAVSSVWDGEQMNLLCRSTGETIGDSSRHVNSRATFFSVSIRVHSWLLLLLDMAARLLSTASAASWR
jgi:hypothetical protein